MKDVKPAGFSKSGTLIFHFFLLVVVFGMISVSLMFPFRARQLPLLIGLPTALLLLLSALGELKPGLVRRFQGEIGVLFDEGIGGRTGAVVSSFVEPEPPPFRCFLIGGAWFCLLLVLVLFLGFLAATLLFVPCFLLVLARYPWWQVFVYTAVLFLVEWYGFDVLLGLTLWKGAAPEILHNFVGGGILSPFF